MSTTSKLGADMLTDEQLIEIASRYAHSDGWLNGDGALNFARALLARQPAAIDKEAVAEVCFVVDCSQSIDDVLPADRRWTIANAISIVAEYRNCQASETKEVMQRFATYMRAALAEASKPAPSVEQDERGADLGERMQLARKAGLQLRIDSKFGSDNYHSVIGSWPALIRFACAFQARAASTSANVADGWKLVPVEPTVAMVDALWDALPKGFTFSNCTPTGVVASIIAAAPAYSANVTQGAEADTRAAVEFYAANLSAALLDFQKRFAAPPAQTAITDDALDAARYRWLKDAKDDFDLMGNHSYYATKLWNVLGQQEDWDATIDAALTAAQSASGDTK